MKILIIHQYLKLIERKEKESLISNQSPRKSTVNYNLIAAIIIALC